MYTRYSVRSPHRLDSRSCRVLLEERVPRAQRVQMIRLHQDLQEQEGQGKVRFIFFFSFLFEMDS